MDEQEIKEQEVSQHTSETGSASVVPEPTGYADLPQKGRRALYKEYAKSAAYLHNFRLMLNGFITMNIAFGFYFFMDVMANLWGPFENQVIGVIVIGVFLILLSLSCVLLVAYLIKERTNYAEWLAENKKIIKRKKK